MKVPVRVDLAMPIRRLVTRHIVVDAESMTLEDAVRKELADELAAGGALEGAQVLTVSVEETGEEIGLPPPMFRPDDPLSGLKDLLRPQADGSLLARVAGRVEFPNGSGDFAMNVTVPSFEAFKQTFSHFPGSVEEAQRLAADNLMRKTGRKVLIEQAGNMEWHWEPLHPE